MTTILPPKKSKDKNRRRIRDVPVPCHLQLSLVVDVALGAQQLGQQHRAAGGTPEGCVGSGRRTYSHTACRAAAVRWRQPCRPPAYDPAWSGAGFPPQSSAGTAWGEGRFSSWARPEKLAQHSLISSMVGLFSPKRMKQAAIWPLLQATRKHWAVMAGPSALTILSPSMWPQSFSGSCSDFSSSPPSRG